MKEKHILVRFDLTKLESIENFEKKIAKSINDAVVNYGYEKFETIRLIEAGVRNDIYVSEEEEEIPFYYIEIELDDKKRTLIGREVQEKTLELLKHNYPVNKQPYDEAIKDMIIENVDMKRLGVWVFMERFKIKEIDNKKHSNPFKKIINFIKHLPRGAGEALRK